MVDLPQEIIKSSRTRVVEVNLPPKGLHNSGKKNRTSARELSSPSPQFQSRRMDRKPGESEDEQVPLVTQLREDKDPAPAPSDEDLQLSRRSKSIGDPDEDGRR